ncbi:nucleoside-diphosphatase, putative [Plasmodium chabaudi chabaudi]|uniref:Nucleoside-diphosphatase, putative n=1 Tax=Plasmodium chabaudi chabaudi TaxID=31271 RepID=A0A4V0KB75_PLACU|nr:nucleoside-diphosphatase, putative [Plasmodium chabaudi chabaudi]VTZ70372.1 nucleoside-diphosphatase, putative [Plasmodium chabaudi chabaudi]|eukprot:XP_016654639.1 adenosine-diphosphatase, putative [Plasmodium chabaudi chabaudi]
MKNDAIKKFNRFIFVVIIYSLLIYLNIIARCEHSGLTKYEEKEFDEKTKYKSIIIDAGSTGTRVYIYDYITSNDNKDIKIYIPSINYRTTPGLVYLLNRYFLNNEKEPFYNYFKKIKNFIYENVKKEERSSTVILIRASGGFRLLTVTQSEKYVNFIKNYFLENFNDFLLIDQLLIKILSGKEEAILSYVSIYALLERLSPSPIIFINNDEEIKNRGVTHNDIDSVNQNDDDHIIGVLESGGATAQIIIKVPDSKMDKDILNPMNYKHKKNNKDDVIEENYKSKNIVKIKLFDKDMYLYCKSYLSLGRQNAMKTYLHYTVHEHYEKNDILNKQNQINKNEATSDANTNQNKFVTLPCFPKDFKFLINNLYKTSIDEELEEYDEKNKKELKDDEYVGIGTGDLNLCRKQIQTILNYSKIDNLPFKIKKFIKLYGIENFHHFAIDILNIPETYNPIPLDTNMYLKKAEEICPLTIDEIRKVVHPNANIEKAQTSCFGLIFLYEFMRHVLKIDNSILFYSTNYVKKNNITWTIAVLLINIPRHLNLIKKKKQNYDNDEL